MRARDFIFKKRLVSEGPVSDAHVARATNLIKHAEHLRDTCSSRGGSRQVCKMYATRAQGLVKELERVRAQAKEQEAEKQQSYKQGWGDAEVDRAEYDKSLFEVIQKLIGRFDEHLAAYQSYVNSVKGIFDMKGLSRDQVKNFVDSAYEGHIIDMPKLVTAKSGSINKFINDEHKEVWDKVGGDFFSLTDPNATRGSIGPAEIAFILLGSPTSKASKGDLEINGKHYEVKASKLSGKKGTSKSGGRLTADSMPKNSTMQKGIHALLTKHFEVKDTDLWKERPGKDPIGVFSLGKDGINFINKLSSYYGPGWMVKDGKKEVEGTVKDRIEVVRSFLYDFMATVMPGTMTEKKNVTPIVNGMIKARGDGTLDPELNGSFFQHYMKANWIEYINGNSNAPHLANTKQKEEQAVVEESNHFDALLFVNRTNMTFFVIETADDLVEAIAQGKVFVTKGATFSDAQNPAAPQLYTA
tara:strand:- start:3400 stop:4809 length:1410 start_codon:yes stop_codon:yes gene_type:complete